MLLVPGKHAEIELFQEQIRVFKTYKDPIFVDNEYFALNFLNEQGIIKLNPKIENQYTVSLDWLKNAKSPKINAEADKYALIIKMVRKLKIIHEISYKKLGFYLTHEDLFMDNILISEDESEFYFIDWGVSGKRNNIYPDIASVALGSLNEDMQFYKLFLSEYFGNVELVSPNLIIKYIHILNDQFFTIRKDNNIETYSLEIRTKKALDMINTIFPGKEK